MSECRPPEGGVSETQSDAGKQILVEQEGEEAVAWVAKSGGKATKMRYEKLLKPSRK